MWVKEKNWETQCLYCVHRERQKETWFKDKIWETQCLNCVQWENGYGMQAGEHGWARRWTVKGSYRRLPAMADRGQICFLRGSLRRFFLHVRDLSVSFSVVIKTSQNFVAKTWQLTLLQENTRKKQEGVHDEPGKPKRPLFLFLAKDTIFITCLYIYWTHNRWIKMIQSICGKKLWVFHRFGGENFSVFLFALMNHPNNTLLLAHRIMTLPLMVGKLKPQTSNR